MIRLLKLQVVEAKPGQVACDIVAVDIDTAPPYEAISYCWGNSEQTNSLAIGSKTKQYIPITPSAHDALCAVTPLDGARYLWIDTICINQEDNSEKDRQIPLMSKIYGNASEVIVFLGDSPNAVTAVTFLNKLYWHYMSKDQKILKETFQKDGDLFHSATVPPPFLNETRSWEAWRDLANNKYWSRAWIVQECGVEKKSP
jgi:hypothetical protein